MTRDVSKLSGWLNADVSCRVGKAGTRCARIAGREQAGRREDVGQQRGARIVHHKRNQLGIGFVTMEERTSNMARMSVTLDVSKLSGWLNASASCRVEREACNARRGVDRKAGGT